MIALDYFLVDVFSETSLAGNPLAVVMNTAGLSTQQMQSIAVEFNLSETTFVERRSFALEQAEGVRVRIFTTKEELEFAGHPTLGTASVLKLFTPEWSASDNLTLAENVGPIPVTLRSSDAGVFAEMTQRDPEFGVELDPAEVARLCGLDPSDLDPSAPPQVVSTGAGFAIVLLRSHAALGRLKVLQDESYAWLRNRGARWFYVLAPDSERPGSFRARMQFNGGEDPATGSAAGCAVSYLVNRKRAPSGQQFLIRQGIEMRRPSEIFVAATLHGARVTGVRVAGSTVPVAKGQLFLP
jgi:trans-2,3-dihydro-3-hydroxyanthranilate isomerase